MENYRIVELVITRTDSQDIIEHELPPPSDEKLNFTSLFAFEFLQKVMYSTIISKIFQLRTIYKRKL